MNAKNRIAEFRRKAELTTLTLARKAGITELELLRAELAWLPLRLPEAAHLAAVLAKPLDAVFPEIRKHTKARGDDLAGALVKLVNSEKAVRALADSGLDVDYKYSLVRFGLGSGATPTFHITGGDRSRFWNAVQEIDEEGSEFFVFNTDGAAVMVNLARVSYSELFFETQRVPDLGEQGPALDEIVVHFTSGAAPLRIQPEPDEDEAADETEDEGLLRTMLFIAEAHVDPYQVFPITDCNGETTFLLARDVAMLTIPEWAVASELMNSQENPSPFLVG